jgi:hypothetical protein
VDDIDVATTTASEDVVYFGSYLLICASFARMAPPPVMIISSHLQVQEKQRLVGIA